MPPLSRALSQAIQWSQTKVANCGLVCCSWFSLPNECSATSVTHHWKGIFRLSQKSESEFLFRALTGPQWRRQFRRIRSGASERDGESMTCYTSLERKFQMQSIHRATISVAATKQEPNRVGVNVLLTLLTTGRTAQLVPTANSQFAKKPAAGRPSVEHHWAAIGAAGATGLR